MSTSRKGNSAKRGQKHQNSWAYKPGLHRTGKQRAQDVASLPLAGLCARCKEKIEWKIKYDKYKPLSTPRKCTLCGDHKVKQAYYYVCRECSKDKEVCAKCGKSGEVMERYETAGQVEAVMRARLGALRERERRTLLRNGDREKAEQREGGHLSEEEEEETEETEDLRQFEDNTHGTRHDTS